MHFFILDNDAHVPFNVALPHVKLYESSNQALI